MIRLSFPGTHLPPLEVPRGHALAEHLGGGNAPVLFGCRTGVCGTCAVVVEPAGALGEPDPDELEVLALVAEDVPSPRLACQLRAVEDAALTPCARWRTGR
jgi:ferredoxin